MDDTPNMDFTNCPTSRDDGAKVSFVKAISWQMGQDGLNAGKYGTVSNSFVRVVDDAQTNLEIVVEGRAREAAGVAELSLREHALEVEIVKLPGELDEAWLLPAPKYEHAREQGARAQAESRPHCAHGSGSDT